MIRVKKRVLSGHTFMGIVLLTCVWLGFPTSSQATTEGLMGYWNFDAVEGSIVPDESGNGLDGILSDEPVPGLEDYPFNETTLVENGYCGKAASFNGQTSKIIVDNFPELKGNLTVELWVKMRSIEPSYLFSQGGSIFSPDMIVQCIGGELYFSAKAGTESLEIYSSSEILINNWYHLAVAIDGKQMKMYLNGSLEDTVAVTENVSADAGALILGFGIYPGWWVLDGWMDEVRIYNRALSQEEIQADIDLCHPDNYDATLHSLAGVIRGNFQGGIKVELSGDHTDITYTDKLGRYSFLDLPVGEYTITPQHENCSFIPSTQHVTLNHSNLNQIDFEVSYSGDKSLGIKLWETDPGIYPWGSPTVSEDKVYLGGFLDGILYCLSTENGERLWEYSIRSSAEETFLSVTETISDKNRVYVVCAGFAGTSYLGYGKILCLNTEDASLIWDRALGHIESWPALYKGNLYIGDGTWGTTSAIGGNLYCIDAETGETLWRYQIDHYTEAGQAIYCGKVYFADYSLGNVYCIDAETGEELWVSAGMVSKSHSSPALSKGRLYIGGGYNRKIHCLDAGTGTEVWSYPTGGTVQSCPAVDGERVYCGSLDGNVYCLDTETGKEIWKFQTEGNVWNHNTYFQEFSSPAVVKGNVYIGAWDNRMYCLNAETGEKVWSYDSGGNVTGDTAISKGKIFFGGGIKTFCLKAGSEEVGEWPMFHKNLYRTGSTAVISGKLVDENGEPLSNVQLVVTGEVGTNFTTAATSSNDRGFYEFAELPEGMYNVEASAQGHQRISKQVTLNPLAPIDDLDFTFQPSICPAILVLEGDSNNLNTLRKFRDEMLSKTPVGQEIIRLYYEWSPVLVEAMEKDEGFKEAIKDLIDDTLSMIRVLAK